MAAPASYDLVVGIDIAARTATVVELPHDGTPARPHTIEQSPAGQAAFLQHLSSLNLPLARILVVMEATGS